MNFASIEFWRNLAIALAVSWIIVTAVRLLRPALSNGTSKLCFFATSIFLLFCESPLTVIAFMWVVIGGWVTVCVVCRINEFNKRARWLLSLGLVIQLLPLIYFKYWGFIAKSLIGWDLELPNMLIPMGLSFYTFQTLGFCVDSIKDKKSVPKFIDYLTFASFFPQIVAGPIERRADLLPQARGLQLRLDRSLLSSAVSWIVLGLFYKMALADNIGVILSGASANPDNAYHIILESICFFFRIYFDFAGYSFVALGLAELFGVRLTLNFISPYWSTSLRTFWRRWHITLSQWLRDYIYFPMGGSRTGWWPLCILVTFLVSGVWHGAGWNFILWGGLHGVGLLVCSVKLPVKIPKSIGWLMTVIFVTYSWLFFYETSMTLLMKKALAVFTPDAYKYVSSQMVDGLLKNTSDLVTISGILLLACIVMLLEGVSLRKGNPYHLLRNTPALMLMSFLTVLLAPVTQSLFIYFNF